MAQTRVELSQKIGIYFTVKCVSCNQTYTFNVNQVYAEQGSNIAAGAVVGGLIGLLGGPLGMIIGGAIGGALGNNTDEHEREKVRQFNVVVV
ncbi:MAG: glycine zipper domain-containing protein [Nitrosotalea sp.]